MPSEESYKLIEGDWNEFHFRRATVNDYDKIIDHLCRGFLIDEPTLKLLGDGVKAKDDLGKLIQYALPQGLSFVTETKDDKKELAGLRITFRQTKETSFDPPVSHQMKVLCKIVELVDGEANYFERFGIDEFASFFVASTLSNYRRCGLAQEMYVRSLAFLTAENFKLVKSVFTNPITRQIVSPLGFTEYSRCVYKDLKEDDGTPVFDPNILTEESFASGMAKVLT